MHIHIKKQATHTQSIRTTCTDPKWDQIINTSAQLVPAQDGINKSAYQIINTSAHLK